MSNRISYYYNKNFGNFFYGYNHPMKPHRVRMTHHLIKTYDMLDKLDMIDPNCHRDIVESIDFTKFHSDEYIDFLEKVNPENMKTLTEQLIYFNIGDDCPIFDGLYDFCKIYTTGSILCANSLNTNSSKIAINWSGGLHHAKKHQASGFCYVNDCVLAILELLNVHERVLYIDIDIHHGDGVEEAFFCTDRVLTLSFHKYGDYFPGTGSLQDIGYGPGTNYAINFPLLEGMDDFSYEYIFKKVVFDIVEVYRPGAILMQCGADSLSGDRLGCFNLSVIGHGKCIEIVKSLNLPLIILGGGGYTLRNVPRCWTYETSILLGVDLDENIPKNDYLDYFYPEYKLHIPVTNMENANSPEYINQMLQEIEEKVKKIERPHSLFDPVLPVVNQSLVDKETLEMIKEEANDNEIRTNIK